MSLATNADLKASLASWSTKTSLSVQIPDFIAWAHEEICRRVRCPTLYARTSLTVDGETINAPDGFLAAKWFYLDLNPRIALKITDSARLIDLTMSCATGNYPSHFAVEGVGTLAFAPLFTGTATGQMFYYKAPTTLVADSDTNVILTKYPFLYLYGGLEALFRFLEDDNNADRYGAQFGALIESVNTEEGKDATRGPLSASSSGFIV